ncbi:TPA: hypothetical protein ACH3X1_002453 [Trebouxia sp. C0004]
MKKDRAEISRTGQPRGVASMPAQMMAKPMSLAAYGGGGAKALDEKGYALGFAIIWVHKVWMSTNTDKEAISVQKDGKLSFA